MSAVPADASSADAAHMRRALELAEHGLYTTDPNPRVGCVLVRDGRVIGEGWHQRAGEPHAEVLALRAAGGEARGATAYVTLEPCSHTGRTPPCAEALVAAGIARVVCAVGDPNPRVAGSGFRRLEAAGVEVITGTLAEAARTLNAGFFSRFERRRAFIRLKLAMSLDARTTPAGGGQAWITGEAARADVQTWRARSSAVLTGAGTVTVDDPRLDVRLAYGTWIRQPLRVVLDPDLRCAPGARVYQGDQAVIFAADAAADRHHWAGTNGSAIGVGGASAGAAAGAEAGIAAGMPELLDGRIPIARVPRAGRGLDLHSIVERLNALEVNELLVECGPRLAAGFLEADLVDELILYVAPRFLGADAAPLAALHALTAANAPRPFTFRDQRLIGADLRLILTPDKD